MLMRSTVALGVLGWLTACQPSDIPDNLPAPSLNAAALTAPKRLPVKPSGVPATAGVVVQAGDSIGHGDGADGWAAIEHLGLPPGVKIYNESHNGWWLLTELGRRAQDVFPHYDPAHASVLVIQAGSNDLAGGSTGDHLYTDVLKPFVASAQAAGFYVAVGTILPRGDSGWRADPKFERERQTYNRLVRANAIGADAVNDLAADAEIGDAKDPATSLLYFDAVHLRQAGQARIAKIEAKTIERLLECPKRTPTQQ